jgi:hypothetical protein
MAAGKPTVEWFERDRMIFAIEVIITEIKDIRR